MHKIFRAEDLNRPNPIPVDISFNTSVNNQSSQIFAKVSLYPGYDTILNYLVIWGDGESMTIHFNAMLSELKEVIQSGATVECDAYASEDRSDLNRCIVRLSFLEDSVRMTVDIEGKSTIDEYTIDRNIFRSLLGCEVR